jgi:N-acylglucosamine-6-phosphate 2-epimerase
LPLAKLRDIIRKEDTNIILKKKIIFFQGDCMNKNELFSKLKNGLIVSCQALETEPLHSSFIMSKMALAAKLGGAVGIRANGREDIEAIKKTVDLPVIGIVKRKYKDSEVYITPTISEVDEIVGSGVEIVSTDATRRLRPEGKTIAEFYSMVREKYPDIILMADISDFEEGKEALKLGFDLISTTLCGYTRDTKGQDLPSFGLIRDLSGEEGIMIIAEGGIWNPQDLRSAFKCGAFSAVIGTAITRPMEITKRFVDSIKQIDYDA